MMSDFKQIGTHSGTFHCDEALACFMLKVLHPNAEVVRTRDPKVLDSLPIIVDVGATYNPSKHRYDHHQKGFTETFDSKHPTKLSSAGLIYKHFGLKVIETMLKKEGVTSCSADDCKLIWLKVYDSLIEGIDGIDNGINQYPSDVKPAYQINTDLGSRVARLNPAWNENGVNIQERFHKAMEITGAELFDAVMFLAKSWLPARDLVKVAMQNRRQVHASGEIVRLDQYTVWKSHLLELEKELKVEPSIKYVLYADESKQWRIQAVPVDHDSFDSRKALPEPWRGLRDDDLSQVSGIPGGVFVHASGFIGGHKDENGALVMAIKALEWKTESADKSSSSVATQSEGENGPVTKKQRTN